MRSNAYGHVTNCDFQSHVAAACGNNGESFRNGHYHPVCVDVEYNENVRHFKLCDLGSISNI